MAIVWIKRQFRSEDQYKFEGARAFPDPFNSLYSEVVLIDFSSLKEIWFLEVLALPGPQAQGKALPGVKVLQREAHLEERAPRREALQRRRALQRREDPPLRNLLLILLTRT